MHDGHFRAAAVLDPSVIETHRSRLDTETVQTRSMSNTLTQLSIENPVYRGNTRGYGFEFCMTETSILTLYLGQHLAFTIGAENTGTRLSKVLTGEDVMVGDPEFDAQVSSRGTKPTSYRIWTESPDLGSWLPLKSMPMCHWIQSA